MGFEPGTFIFAIQYHIHCVMAAYIWGHVDKCFSELLTRFTDYSGLVPEVMAQGSKSHYKYKQVCSFWKINICLGLFRNNSYLIITDTSRSKNSTHPPVVYSITGREAMLIFSCHQIFTMPWNSLGQSFC